MIDSAVVSAHQHSAGARKTYGPKAIGRSRGGLTTKLHLAIDANGRPLRLIITEGPVADIVCAEELIGHLPAEAVIADKGYDADTLVQAIRNAGAKAVIPPRSNRIRKRRYNRTIYRTRNLIERFVARFKHFRRVATRYEKPADTYLVFASLACVFALLVKM